MRATALSTTQANPQRNKIYVFIALFRHIEHEIVCMISDGCVKREPPTRVSRGLNGGDMKMHRKIIDSIHSLLNVFIESMPSNGYHNGLSHL